MADLGVMVVLVLVCGLELGNTGGGKLILMIGILLEQGCISKTLWKNNFVIVVL